MTKIETITESLQAEIQRAEYTKNLLRGLNNEPQNYEYMGEVLDLGDEGECACKHKIRWGFLLKHKSGDAAKKKIVGSTCVNYFQGVNEELFHALCQGVKQLHEQLSKAKADAKRAQAQADVDALAARWTELYNSAKARYIAYRERGEMAPRALWEAFGSYRYGVESNPPEYTRPADYKRWYKAQIARLESL